MSVCTITALQREGWICRQWEERQIVRNDEGNVIYDDLGDAGVRRIFNLMVWGHIPMRHEENEMFMKWIWRWAW